MSGFCPEGSEGKQNRTEDNGTRQTPETGALSRHKKLTEPARERERARLSTSLYSRPGEPKTFWCTDRSRAAALRQEAAATEFENPADKNLFPAF